LSIRKLIKDINCSVTFFLDHCIFQDLATGRTIGQARVKDGLYMLEVQGSSSNSPSLSFISVNSNKTDVWNHHCRLGHLSFKTLRNMFPSLFKNLDVEQFHCEICEFAKHHRVPFPTSDSRSVSPFTIIHSDIWGPYNIPNISGAKGFVTFINDCTRMTWVYLVKRKSDVSRILPNFTNMIRNQFRVSIKGFRTDNARDYFNQILSPYFEKEGIIHQSSCVNTPQQNGLAERKNRHLLETTRALLFQHQVPKNYWGEAVLTSTYLINRIPSRVIGFKSPLNYLSEFFSKNNFYFKIPPRIFGCVTYVHIHKHQRDKLDARALKCVFIRYSITQKGYKCYYPSSKRFLVSKDVSFNENQSFFNKSSLQGEENNTEDKTNNDFDDFDIFSFQIPSRQQSSPIISPSCESPNITLQGETTVDRPLQVYRRRIQPDLTLLQAQETEPEQGNELSHSSLPIPDLYQPIAIRKGRKECTKSPLYPITNFMSFQKFSPSHKAFLSKINTIPIPKTLYEALRNEN